MNLADSEYIFVYFLLDPIQYCAIIAFAMIICVHNIILKNIGNTRIQLMKRKCLFFLIGKATAYSTHKTVKKGVVYSSCE